MKHVSIIGKFLIIMACFGLFSVGVALYSGKQLTKIDTSYNELLDHESAAALSLAGSNRSIQASRASIGDLLMSRTDEMNAAAEKEIKQNQEEFIKDMDLAISALPEKTEFSQIKTEGLQALANGCGAAIKAGRAATSEPDVASSQKIFLSECRPALAAISPKLIALASAVADTAQRDGDRLSEVTSNAVVATLSAVAIGLATVLVLGFLAIRSWLVRPIQQISKTMNVLANGDLSTAVEGADRRDEIGGMAKAVQVFKDNGLRTRELEQDAETNRTASEAARARAAEGDRQRALEMAEATSGLADGLKHFLNFTKAQVKPQVKPDRVRNDLRRKTVTLETDIRCLHRRNLRPTQNVGNCKPVNVTTPLEWRPASERNPQSFRRAPMRWSGQTPISPVNGTVISLRSTPMGG